MIASHFGKVLPNAKIGREPILWVVRLTMLRLGTLVRRRLGFARPFQSRDKRLQQTAAVDHRSDLNSIVVKAIDDAVTVDEPLANGGVANFRNNTA